MSDQTKRGTWYLYFLFYFSLNKTVFESNFINSTNETANIEYGDVHQWWAADNPKIVDDSPGIIQVYSICHSKVCYSNILQATGTGCVSGSYIIQFPGENLKLSLNSLRMYILILKLLNCLEQPILITFMLTCFVHLELII